MDFDVAKVYKNYNYNSIIFYVNKYNINLKLEDFNMEEYIFRLMFNFVFDIVVTIYIICNLNLFYLYKILNI